MSNEQETLLSALLAEYSHEGQARLRVGAWDVIASRTGRGDEIDFVARHSGSGRVVERTYNHGYVLGFGVLGAAKDFFTRSLGL